MYSVTIISEYGDLMLVISDSSTLILLAKSNLLDCTISYFNGITIPKKVEKEVVEEGLKQKHEDAMIVRELIETGKIKVVTFTKKASSLQKEYGLHAGEADAIELYFHLKASLLGIDDGKAIKVCRLLGIKFFTALSLLIYFTQEKTISNTDALIYADELEKCGRYTKEEMNLALNEIRGVPK